MQANPDAPRYWQLIVANESLVTASRDQSLLINTITALYQIGYNSSFRIEPIRNEDVLTTCQSGLKAHTQEINGVSMVTFTAKCGQHGNTQEPWFTTFQVPFENRNNPLTSPIDRLTQLLLLNLADATHTTTGCLNLPYLQQLGQFS